MNETSKNNLTTYFQEPESLIIVDSSALSNDGTDSFFSYLSEIDDGDVREIGVVIPVKTFETLKKILTDKSQDYQLRKHASDSVMRIAELIGTNRIKVFGDDSDKMDENTVILTQLARLRTSYDILLLSDNLNLLRDADLINHFSSVDGKAIALGSLDTFGELVLHEGLIRLADHLIEDEPEAANEAKLETELKEEFTEDFDRKILEEAARAAVAEIALQEDAIADAEIAAAEKAAVEEVIDEIAPEEIKEQTVIAEESVAAAPEVETAPEATEPVSEPSLESFFVSSIDLGEPAATIPAEEEKPETQVSSIEEVMESEPEAKIEDAHFSSGWGEPISEIPAWNATEVVMPQETAEAASETSQEVIFEELKKVPTGAAIEIEPPERPEKTEKSSYPSGGMFSFFKKFRRNEKEEVPAPADLPEVDLKPLAETPVESVAETVAETAQPEVQIPVQPEAPVMETVETPAPVVEEPAVPETAPVIPETNIEENTVHHIEETSEAEDDSVEMVYCINCGRKVPADETVEEVCEDCLNMVVGETNCIICGKPVPVLFRNRYIDQNENSLICESCQNGTPEAPAVIFSQDTVSQPEEAKVSEPAVEDEDMVVCINCGKTVPASETVEEVCQECLEKIVDVKTCIGCGAVIPITFRDRYIDQTEDRLYCDNCLKESSEKAEAESVVEEVAETPVERPIEETIEEPVEMPVEEPVNTVVEESVEEAAEEPKPESVVETSWADLGASFTEPAQEEVKEEVQEEVVQQTAPQPKLAQCQKCHKLVTEDELVEGYCQDCLNEVDHYTFCIECGTKIPVTFKDQYIDHAEQRFYCDDCMQRLGLTAQVEDEPEEVQLVECAHCHQMVPADQTEQGYCQNCLNEVVDQGFCIECGARIPITFREAYIDQSPRRLYCDNCQPQAEGSDDNDSNNNNNNGPDLSGWSVL